MRLDLPDVPGPDVYPGAVVVEGEFIPGHHFIGEDGAVREAGPAPGPFYVQDGRNGWVFDRVSAEMGAQLRRADLLSKTDWVELPSAVSRLTPDTLAEALQWRQDLRDMTSQVGYPEHIDWPEPPRGLPGLM